MKKSGVPTVPVTDGLLQHRGRNKACQRDWLFCDDQDAGIFIGNLRRSIEEVIPKLEKNLSEATERDLVVWFMEEKANDIIKQALWYNPKQKWISSLSLPSSALHGVTLVP